MGVFLYIIVYNSFLFVGVTNPPPMAATLRTTTTLYPKFTEGMHDIANAPSAHLALAFQPAPLLLSSFLFLVCVCANFSKQLKL